MTTPPVLCKCARAIQMTLAGVCLLSLLACDGNSLSEQEISSLIRTYVAAQPDVCVPERIVYAQSLYSTRLARILQQHGLVRILNPEQATRSGQRTVYEWTTEGEQYLKPMSENGVSVRGLCFAKRSFDKITTQHPPQKGQSTPVWTVQFIQRIDNAASWSQDEQLKVAMPELTQTLAHAKSLQTVRLHKVNGQWVIP